jgi:hypothetical protein
MLEKSEKDWRVAIWIVGESWRGLEVGKLRVGRSWRVVVGKLGRVVS